MPYRIQSVENVNSFYSEKGMKLSDSIIASYMMLFFIVSKIGNVYGYRTVAKRSIFTTSLTRIWKKNSDSADYSGAAGRVPTTPESRWPVLAVGVIESPYVTKYDTPKQATISRHDGGARAGSIRLFPGYEECIDQLDGFDFIWVITYMHLNSGFKKKIRPMPREGSSSYDIIYCLICFGTLRYYLACYHIVSRVAVHSAEQ